MLSCQWKCSCTARALVLSAVVGVLTTFLQITGMLVLSTVFLWVAFGIAVGYLLVLTGAEVIAAGRRCIPACCGLRSTVLAGILGTILVSLILLAVGIASTSLVYALLAGGLLFFFTLVLTGIACYVQCLSGCGIEG